MKIKVGWVLILLFLIISPCWAEEKNIYFGGSLNFTFGDPDVLTMPGPQFDTDKTGSASDISLYMRNRKVQAGVSLSIAQAAENVTSIGTLEEVPFPLDNAYIRCTDLLDLFRAELHIRGEETALGTLAVTGTEPDPVEEKLTYNETDGIFSLELERGVLGDFNIGVEANQIAGKSATASTEGVEHIWGIKGITSYEGEYLYAKLDSGVMNIRYPEQTFIAEWEGGTVIGDFFDLNLNTEATMIGINTAPIAIGGGGEIEANFFGFSPKFRIYAKNENFGKNEKLLSIADSLDDFNTRTGNRELGLDANAAFSFFELTGSRLLTLKGGYNTILTGVKRWGWNAGVDLNFYDFNELPLTGGFSISQYGDTSLGIFGNSDLLWNTYISFNYYGLELKAEGGRKIYEDPMDPSGGSRNSAIGYSISALVYF